MGRRLGGRMLMVSLLALVTLVAVSVAAYAYWGATGSGAGPATTGTTIAMTLSPGTPSGALYPGGLADVILTVSNPNVFQAHIGSLGLDVSQGTGGVSVSGCTVAAATLSFTTQTNGGAGWTIPAKVGAVNGTLPITLTNALTMGVGAADACQGASSTVYLKAGP